MYYSFPTNSHQRWGVISRRYLIRLFNFFHSDRNPHKYAATYSQGGNVNKHDPFLVRVNVGCIMVRQPHAELSPWLHARFYKHRYPLLLYKRILARTHASVYYAKVAYVEHLPRHLCILKIVCTILADEKETSKLYFIKDYKRDIYNNYK